MISSILIFSGCTGEKLPHSLATAYQNKYFIEEDSLVRNVASVDESKMCFESSFNVITLQKEVADYENKINGSPVRGSWKHLNLENLPVAQANFLKEFGDRIGDQKNPNSISYDGCNSLPCIFNRIYQRNEFDIAGYVHYLWYLKFGNYLSLDNRVYSPISETPGVYNGKQFQVVDYLYNNDELYGLWRVIHMLKAPYTNLTNLSEVQRVPRNEPLEGFPPLACGLAWPTGYILLNDKCLITQGFDKNISGVSKNKGFLYIGVIHEMTHMLDTLEAKQSKTRYNYRSEEQDYLDLIGFKKQEYVGANAALVSTWTIRPGSKIIREYSGTTPVENFADTLAFFRQDGDQTKDKIDSTQYKWTSSNYFHGESYDNIGKRELLLTKYEQKISKDLLTIVTDCFSTQKVFKSDYFIRSDFELSKLSPKMFNCISYEAEAISKRLTSHVQLVDPDGCGTTLPLVKKDNPWDLSVKQSLKKQFAIYIDEITNDPQYLAKVINFNLTLKNRYMANLSVLECYKGSTLDDLSECYKAKVSEKAKIAALELHFPEDHAIEMGDLYLSNHPYSRVIQDLYLAYRTILNGHNTIIEKESEDLWQSCLNRPHNDDLKPSGAMFSPRKGYLISSVYNCLNEQLPITLKEILKVIVFDNQNITHPAEEQIILEFLSPKINERLYVIHEASMTEESKELEAHFVTLADGIRSSLLADFSWITNINNNLMIDESCKKYALSQINYLPLYHLKRDAFSEMIMTGPCLDITSEVTVKTFLDKSRQEVDTNVYSKVEQILENNIEKRALSCRESIPWRWERTRATVRIPRKACLNKGREQIELDTIQELKNNSSAEKFGITDDELRSKILEYYDSLRSKIEIKHF